MRSLQFIIFGLVLVAVIINEAIGKKPCSEKEVDGGDTDLIKSIRDCVTSALEANHESDCETLVKTCTDKLTSAVQKKTGSCTGKSKFMSKGIGKVCKVANGILKGGAGAKGKFKDAMGDLKKGFEGLEAKGKELFGKFKKNKGSDADYGDN